MLSVWAARVCQGCSEGALTTLKPPLDLAELAGGRSSPRCTIRSPAEGRVVMSLSATRSALQERPERREWCSVDGQLSQPPNQISRCPRRGLGW
jgi:hypothetical protein